MLCVINNGKKLRVGFCGAFLIIQQERKKAADFIRYIRYRHGFIIMSNLKNGKKINRNVVPYLLLSPAIVYYLFFWIRPVAASVVDSFRNSEGKFTFQNYTMVFQDASFRPALVNTIVFCVISIILQYLLALGLALLLNRQFKGSRLILFVALIPMAIPPTAVAVLWKTGFTTNGWMNSLLIHLNLISEPINWLATEGFEAVLFLVAIDTWTVLPSVMIIILAGLQNFPKELKEAGLVFGASRMRVLKDITLPVLKPTIVTSIILRLIASIQVWSIAVMILGYGKVPFLVERIAYYVEVIPGMNVSKAMATTYSVLVTAIILITTIIYLRISGKGVGGETVE